MIVANTKTATKYPIVTAILLHTPINNADDGKYNKESE